MIQFRVDQMDVTVCGSRSEMGHAAAARTAALIRHLLAERPGVRMVFAAAPSQNEFLDRLAALPGIDWARITAFHMDEYVGLPGDAPQLFRRYLEEHLFTKVPFSAVHTIDGNTGDSVRECARYAALLAEAPIDIVCMGIGENGHIAFNDPPVADFNDRAVIKPVELEWECRQQQVNDGCFESLEAVPARAITLTVPALLAAEYLTIVVPGTRKAWAVDQSLYAKISTACPASILRTHRHAQLFLDAEAAAAALARHSISG